MKTNSYFGAVLAAVCLSATVAQASALPSTSALTPAPKAKATPEKSPADEKYYHVTMLLEENFDKFTAGTMEAHDTQMIDGYVDNSLTQTPGWSALAAYQAGGMVYVARSEDVNANISTPIFEVPNNGKPVVITLRSRLGNPQVERDWVEVYMCAVITENGETKAPIHYNDYAYVYNEWKDYSFTISKNRGAQTTFFFSFNGYDADVLIDDIEIKFLDPKLDIPVVKPYTDFTTTGFTANWEAVADAESYLVNLYTLNDDRDKTRNYIVKDQPVSGLSYTFTGLETDKNIYYYTVQAVKGDALSAESEPVRIHDLVMPVNVKVTDLGDEGVKLTWDAVPGAEYYEVETLREHTATADEEVVLIRENFDGLVSDGTIDEPDQTPPAQEELDAFTETPGWIATYPAHVNGAYCIIGYFYQTSGQLVFIETPLLDMSAAGGKINVEADLYARTAGMDLESFRAIFRTMKLTDDGRLVTTDSYETERIPSEWTHVKTTLGGGTQNSVLEICSRDGWLYMDNIKITQNLKAGEKVKAAYKNLKAETNEVIVPVNDLVQGQKLHYRVRAVKEVWDEYHFSCDEKVQSPYTEFAVHQVQAAGIEDVAADGAEGPTDVYNLQGIKVKSNATDLEGLPAGVYIMAGKKVIK